MNSRYLDIAMFHRIADKIFNHEYLFRQEGATTTYLYLMLSEILFMDEYSDSNFYMYVGYNPVSMKHKLESLLNEFEIPYIQSTNQLLRLENGMTFEFISKESVRDFWCFRGLRINKMYIDLDSLENEKLKLSLEFDGILIRTGAKVI